MRKVVRWAGAGSCWPPDGQDSNSENTAVEESCGLYENKKSRRFQLFEALGQPTRPFLSSATSFFTFVWGYLAHLRVLC